MKRHRDDFGIHEDGMPIEAPADGVITEILVEPNQPVQEGQVVARMDDQTD